MFDVSTSLIVKLASIAVHAEELFSPDGRDVDRTAVESLLADPEVRAFIDDPAHAVMLPLKRKHGIGRSVKE